MAASDKDSAQEGNKREDNKKKLMRQLLQAVIEGDISSLVDVVACMESPAITLNESIHAHFRPLFIACQGQRKSHAVCVRYLLKQRARPRDPDTGRTGLHFACESDSKVCVEEWLQIFPHQHSSAAFDGSTPLGIAAQCGSYQSLQRLLRAGACPDLNSVGTPPLVLAASNGCLKSVGTLLRFKADTTTSDSRGINCVYIAAARGNEKVLSYLLENSPADLSEKALPGVDGQTPLIAASRRGSCPSIDTLINFFRHRFIDRLAEIVNQTDLSGRSALYAAAQEGHLLAVKLLHRAGARIHPSKRELDPLTIAVRKGRESCVKYLLENGADIRRRNHEGKSIWYLACIHRRFLLLRLLAKYGAAPKSWVATMGLPYMRRRANGDI